MGGFGLDAQWSDDIHHAIHSLLTGERDGYYADYGSLEHVAVAMTQPYVYAGEHSDFRQRIHGRPPTNLSAHRFLAYIQNHDQLGNRAQGDRLTHLASGDRAKIGAALVLLSPYVPMLFQGEEWGSDSPFQFFVDFASEPELAAAVVTGRTKEFEAFGWDPSQIPNPNDIETFRRSKLDWNELNRPEHVERLAWYRSLIALRKSLPALTNGRLNDIDVFADEAAGTLIVHRAGVTIACNFAPENRSIPSNEETSGALLLASKPVMTAGENGITLPPESVAVFGNDQQPQNVAIRSAA